MSASPPTIGHIDLRPNRDGQLRAYIVGTRMRVQDIVSDHERLGWSPEEIAREYPHLSLAQIHAALAYYYDHREDIRGYMRTDEEFVRRAEAAQRLANPVVGKHANDDAIPS